MGVISWILLGLIAGAIAKAIHPGGSEPGGILGTMAVGGVGALLGGLVASAAGIGSLGSLFNLGTWLIAILGAIVVLAIINLVTRSAGGPRSA